MQKIGHIEEVQQIPPEVPEVTCELCLRKPASMIFLMDKKHSEDMSLCMDCSERISAINSMMIYIEEN